MASNMQPSQGSDPPLESRLRNLILTNSDEASSRKGQGTISHSGGAVQQYASRNNQAGDMQEAGSFPSSGPAQGRGKASKKRPNQAQRRQMNAQLSIPVDTRAPVEYTPKAHPPYHANEHQQHGRFYPHHQPTRSHGGSYRGGPQNHPGTYPNLPQLPQPHHYPNFYQGPNGMPHHQQDWRAQQPQHHGFSKGVNVISPEAFPSRGRQGSHPSLYNPGGYRQNIIDPEELAKQTGLLDQLCHSVLTSAEIELSEIAKKEEFRLRAESICRSVISHYEIHVHENAAFPPSSVQLKCFGSLSSGFATKTADMDLALLSPLSRLPPELPESPLPRLVEKALLESGFGARLLTRTRVPIIKLCEKPNEELRRALLDERTKWENGITTDIHDAEDEALDDSNAPNGVDMTQESPQRESLSDEQSVELALQTTVSAGQPRKGKVPSLKQARNQSITSYSGHAKRLLRQLNGRDVTQSNLGELTEDDFSLLNAVCESFVNGLHDESLKHRILTNRSFYAPEEPPYIHRLSLAGIIKMVEGEQLFMLWETRSLTEGNPQREEMSQSVIGRWRNLQDTKRFGMNPLVFNKELHYAVESLRCLPSIQFMLLKQEQHESATEYYTRVVRIMNGLRGPNVPNPIITSRVADTYISGILNEQIREQVRNFALVSGTPPLKAIARMHKALQLAAEYEKALEKCLYSDADAAVVWEYISLLRRGLITYSTQENGPNNYVVPVTQATAQLVQRIRQLPDPSRLAPNQPRDRYHDKLEFPKNGVGVQCDINFSAHLALQNTLLLRCYSYTDPRVRPLVLFVKYWAKVRGINNAYRGTLSSYGYVLMMLHYLVNVAEPFVCPNLQQLAPPDPDLPPSALEGLITCKGRNVRFWRDEQEIQRLAGEGQLNHNKESFGALLRGFFEYYAQNNQMSIIQKRGFDWGRDVISLRTPGGLLTKQEKGWTGAKTIIQPQTGGPNTATDASGPQTLTPTAAEHPTSPAAATPATTQQSAKPGETKEIRLRFLFAIEDPFECDHNVARTVTHNGIVNIRDEFRRAWRIIRSAGKVGQPQEDLLEDAKQHTDQLERKQFADLVDEIHGPIIFP